MSVRPSTQRLPEQQIDDVAELAMVRRRFVDWLRAAGVDGERIEDLSVVVSELGANAIRESPDGSTGSSLSAWVEDDRLVLEVRNEVAAHAEPDTDWDLEDPLRTGGRGLLLVSAFVDDVDTRVDDGGLVVRCTTGI